MPILTEIRRKLPLRPRPEPDEIADLSSDRVHHIRVQDIIPNRAQPRSAFNQNAIARLADSIRRYGILQPLTVRKIFIPRPHGSDGPPTLAYELVAGERRLRAAKLIYTSSAWVRILPRISSCGWVKSQKPSTKTTLSLKKG